MPELTVQDLAAKLRTERFDRAASARQALTDPIVDTPMVVTLDELRPYELNPRIARNPKHDEIKTSIRERGLDAPPAITRRPGESHFIIRNGGNTRLSILRELWAETKEERFFRIPCLFRPWSARGEIVALTGHLAENELHGDLSFIERALGVEKARELYEQELGNSLSQRELARRLTADGYPISHSLVSRMQDTLRHLLPAIPTILYAGLGKHQVERLIALRKAASRVWERHAPAAQPTLDFQTLFLDVLSCFDAEPDGFDARRVQDQLLKHMAKVLATDYDTLALEIIDAEGIADALNRDPASQPPLNAPFPIEERAVLRSLVAPASPRSVGTPAQLQRAIAASAKPIEPERSQATTQRTPERELADAEEWDEESEEHDDVPVEHAERRSSTPEVGEDGSSRSRDERVRTDDARTEKLHGAFDLWHIEPSLDTPGGLRSQIAQLVADVAQEGSLAHRIKAVNEGVGYVCVASHSRSREPPLSPFQRTLLALLTALSAADKRGVASVMDDLSDALGPLLQGSPEREHPDQVMPRLSDAALVKLFRFICLSRRLLDLESAECSSSDCEPM